MKLRYVKLKENAFPPLKKRIYDAGIDFRVIDDVKWTQSQNGWFAIAYTGIALEVPRGWYLATAPRSSMLFNKKVVTFHSVIDTGYTGELTFLLHYLGDNNPPKIVRGDKVAQVVLIQTPIIHTEFDEVDELPDYSDRGNQGFGSSGR